jgi:hypothetical protein
MSNKLRCSECKKELDVQRIKYHTPTTQQPVHVFCDAYCSHDWHVINKPRTKERKG